MKKASSSRLDDELLPEYDFARMKGGVRGKYAKRFPAGASLVLLEPDVAAAFPSGDDVNEALRLVVKLAKVRARHRRPPRRQQLRRRTPAASGSSR